MLSQCRVAIKNEQSQRVLGDQITKLTNKKTEKQEKKRVFELEKRKGRLFEATPYDQNPTRNASISD